MRYWRRWILFVTKARYYERIYKIKFDKTTKTQKDIGQNNDIYYIMFVTKTRIYQFNGPGEKKHFFYVSKNLIKIICFWIIIVNISLTFQKYQKYSQEVIFILFIEI